MLSDEVRELLERGRGGVRMIAFDIRVNRQKTCVVGGAQIFSAMVSHVDDGSGQIDFNVTGMKYTDDVERSILWPNSDAEPW